MSGTFVILQNLTENGIIFGKNSEGSDGEAHDIVYVAPETYGKGHKLKIEGTDVEVDQVESTYAVALSKPANRWGAEMGANSCGLVIGRETVDCGKKLEFDDRGLHSVDFLRLGLERSSTAAAALKVITDLIEAHGQKRPHFNSFIIVDPSECWVLETAGRHWVAEQVKDGCRHVSKVMTITTGYQMTSEGLESYAVDNKLWDGQGKLNWAEVCGCPKDELKRNDEIAQLLKNEAQNGHFIVPQMMKVLRHPDINVPAGNPKVTASSQVSILFEDRPSAHWFTGTPDAALSVFKPFVFTPQVKISSHTTSSNDPGTQHNLFKLHSKAVASGSGSLQQLLSMEATCVNETINFLSNYTKSTDISELDELFKDVVETEVKFYK